MYGGLLNLNSSNGRSNASKQEGSLPPVPDNQRSQQEIQIIKDIMKDLDQSKDQ